MRPSNARSRLSWACMMLVNLACVGCAPHWLVASVAHFDDRCTWYVPTRERVVALTIDDGPDPEVVPRLLDLLDEYHARATFFIVSDRIKGNQALVKEMIERGHELGNHMTKDETSIALPLAEFRAKFWEADESIRPFFPAHWFRPGGGWHDEDMLDTIESNLPPYRCAMGGVYPFDAQHACAGFSEQFIRRSVRPGSVIVLHDIGDRGERTIQVLGNVLPWLADRGFRVVTLSALYDLGDER